MKQRGRKGEEKGRYRKRRMIKWRKYEEGTWGEKDNKDNRFKERGMGK